MTKATAVQSTYLISAVLLFFFTIPVEGNGAPSSVAITNPADGSVVSNNVTIEANVSDSANLEMVRFLVDGIPLANVSTEPYSVLWNTSGLIDGSLHTISATAYDTDGNNSTHSVSVIVNNAAGSKIHTFIFYLDPALIPDMEFARTALPKYVDDMNFILSKNTPRKLSFDPETGIILTSVKPHTDFCCANGSLPNDGFDIWAYANISDYPFSYGGYAGLDTSGAAVLAGLKWRRIYDPDLLANDSENMSDYWKQINNMLHEMAHVYKAGVSEYYSLATIRDNTGIKPILNISLGNASDSYWSNKKDFYIDPLLGNIQFIIAPIGSKPTDRTGLLKAVWYANLTAIIMRDSYRNSTVPLPDTSNIKIRIFDRNMRPLPNTTLNIWNVKTPPPYENSLLINATTDGSGEFVFGWGGGDLHNNFNNLRLVKAYNGNYSSAKYVSVFDGEMVKILEGKNEWVIDLIINFSRSADTNQDGCVDNIELIAFIDRWEVSNQDVTMGELIEAIGLWKRGC